MALSQLDDVTRQYLDEAWAPPTVNSYERILNWFPERLEYYRLESSQTRAAVRQMLSLIPPVTRPRRHGVSAHDGRAAARRGPAREGFLLFAYEKQMMYELMSMAFYLAVALLDGRVIPLNYDEAFKYFKHFVELRGDLEWIWAVADIYMSVPHHAQDAQFMRQVVMFLWKCYRDLGQVTDASINLHLNITCFGESEINFHKYRTFQRKLIEAEASNVDSMFHISEMYRSGEAVEKNMQKSTNWFYNAMQYPFDASLKGTKIPRRK